LESKTAALLREKALKKYGHERIGVLINSPKNIVVQYLKKGIVKTNSK